MGRTSDARQRIVQAAIELFHARSYDAVGVAEICREAGVVKGSFYHFFGSKDDLALAVIDALAEHGHATYSLFFAPDIPPLQRLERCFDHFYAEYRDMKQQTGCIHGCPFGNLAAELSTRSPAIRQRLAQVYDTIAGLYQSALDDAVVTGDVSPDLDTRVAAEMLVVYLQGMSIVAKVYNDPEKVRHLSRHAIEVATGNTPQNV